MEQSFIIAMIESFSLNRSNRNKGRKYNIGIGNGKIEMQAATDIVSFAHKPH